MQKYVCICNATCRNNRLLPSDISKNTHPQPLPTFYLLKKEDTFNFLNNQMYTLAQIRKNA